MSTPIERVNDELARIVNHSGLNPCNTLAVETEMQNGHCFTFVTGVDAEEAQLAVGVALTGRRDVEVKVVSRCHNDDYLIVTQPVRE